MTTHATTPHDPLSHHFWTMAHNNAWANHRLLGACAQLDAAAFVAPRTGFFPSIKATLNHIITVDWMYVDALEREARGAQPHGDIHTFFEPEQPFADCATLRAAQHAVDLRLIAYCAALRDGELGRLVAIRRTTHLQRDSRTRLLAHLFQHQIHHRGQVHTMLAGTAVAPPQLDEFFCAQEAHLRAAEFAELGWTEDGIWGDPDARAR